MALNATVGRKGGSIAKTDVTATVSADKGDAGIKITTSKLTVVAHGLTGIPKEQFAEVAKEAEGKCPGYQALRRSSRSRPDNNVRKAAHRQVIDKEYTTPRAELARPGPNSRDACSRSFAFCTLLEPVMPSESNSATIFT